MKFFLPMLSLAILNQVSLAAVLGRVKREITAEGFEVVADFIKQLADATGPMVKSVRKQMPQTEVYSTYKEELEEYISAYEEFKNEEGVCYYKSIDLLEKFDELTDKYDKEDATPEAKKLDELFKSYDSKKLEKEIEKFYERVVAMEMDKSDENEMDRSRIFSKMSEIC